MKKKKSRRLNLNRETIQNLDKPLLRKLDGGVVCPTTFSWTLLPKTVHGCKDI